MPPIKFVSTFLTLLCVAVLVFVAAPEAIAEVDEVAIEVPLSGIAHEMVFDKTRQRFYVSIPAMNEVLSVSIAPFGVQGSFVFGSQPRGVDISHDDSKLFVALFDAGAVGVGLRGSDSNTQVVLLDEQLSERVRGDNQLIPLKPGTYWLHVKRAFGAPPKKLAIRLVSAPRTTRKPPSGSGY